MSYYIFRNNMVENIFGTEDVVYSGYEDISCVPENVNTYVWLYQIPVKWDQQQTAATIDAYLENLQLVFSRIPKGRTFVALTLVDVFPTRSIESDLSVRKAICRYNEKLFELAALNHHFKTIDFSEFVNLCGTKELISWKFYFISQMYLTPKVAPLFRNWFESKMRGIALKRKKCLVLDLDNTLWGGVLGEDGIDGIKIGGDYPGKAFLYFQEALLQLSKAGTILAICSKNNETDVEELWDKNPFLLLKKEHFAAMRINWKDKASNIKELASELNIGLDSFVFVDDNPTERELIKQTLPMVAVPDFPTQPYMLPEFYIQLVRDYFSVYEITTEDEKKTEQYKANAERVREQSKYGNFEDYLRSLEIQIKIQRANNFNIPRIAQMTQKTNQFNLTTLRMTEADVLRFEKNGGKIFCASVGDKFGDSGITGAIFINRDCIENMLFSCRVLGKGIENAFLKTILRILNKDGLAKIHTQYIPTAKNGQTSEFYDKVGFTLMEEKEGTRFYEADLGTLDLTIPDYYSIEISK